MWAGPGADGGRSRRRCGPVPAQMWGFGHTFSSTRQAANSSGLSTVFATMHAPCLGGDENVGRMHTCKRRDAEKPGVGWRM